MTPPKTKPELATTTVALADLKHWPGNARRGVVSKIKESMITNGIFQPLIVQKSTMQVIAGNHRLLALTELHQDDPEKWGPQADVILLDVDDHRASKMNLADNKTADSASWDDRLLVEQLQAIIESDDDLVGTGFAEDELDDMILRLEDEIAAGEDDGLADMPNGAIASYTIVFDDEEQLSRWNGFVRGLRQRDESGATVGTLLIEHIEESGL